jgi:hypothetical protein
MRIFHFIYLSVPEAAAGRRGKGWKSLLAESFSSETKETFGGNHLSSELQVIA